MKQGRAPTIVTGTKAEPVSKVVNPGAVSQIGIHHVQREKEPLYAGRGLKAPMVSQKSHKGGSQGNY